MSVQCWGRNVEACYLSALEEIGQELHRVCPDDRDVVVASRYGLLRSEDFFCSFGYVDVGDFSPGELFILDP